MNIRKYVMDVKTLTIVATEDKFPDGGLLLDRLVIALDKEKGRKNGIQGYRHFYSENGNICSFVFKTLNDLIFCKNILASWSYFHNKEPLTEEVRETEAYLHKTYEEVLQVIEDKFLEQGKKIAILQGSTTKRKIYRINPSLPGAVSEKEAFKTVYFKSKNSEMFGGGGVRIKTNLTYGQLNSLTPEQVLEFLGYTVIRGIPT